MEANQVKIYIDLPIAALEFISDNKIDISELLSNEGIQANITHDVLPDSDSEYRSKDLSLVILCGAGATVAISFAISRLLKTIFHRPQLVEYFEYIPIKDEFGNPIKDINGTPQLVRVKKFELLEPKAESNTTQGEIKLTASDGLLIKFSSNDEPK